VSTAKYHLVFVDDDPWEIEEFSRLYSGDRFRVTAVQAASPATAMERIRAEAQKERVDLFVLDLYYPSVDHPPSGLDSKQQEETRLAIENIVALARNVEGHYADGQALLRATHSVMRQAGNLLVRQCRALRQSPEGGIALLGEVAAAYPSTPKAFYSRKATLKDAKEALAAGALDVISKPEPGAHGEAESIAEQFQDLADRKPPKWGRDWLGQAVGITRDWGPLVYEVLKRTLPGS